MPVDRSSRKNNSAAGVLAGAAVGTAAGYALGRTLSVPDVEARLDEVEKLIEEGDEGAAVDLLVKTVEDVDHVYTRMGGAPPQLRKRMVQLNEKLSDRHQLFVLQDAGRGANPTRKLKAKLLR